ncbi:MAG: MBOAT family protein [Gemmiger sp.]|nr:MBOAT family protein [Gemmiger sp.]
MQVNTLLYLGFFAAVALLNYLLPRLARPYFLLLASYAFYAYSPANRALLPVLLGATVITWAAGLAIAKARHKAVQVVFLLLSIGSCLGVLLYYKYWNMLAAGLAGLVGVLGGAAPPTLDLITPLGLSYFTFAALSYSLDVYKKRSRVEYNLFHYALFVSFFPTMLTGPIERYPHLRPQIEKSRRFSYARCAGGAFRMLWGYTKKLVIADNLAGYVSLVYAAPGDMSGPNLAAATILFAIQLYMDFSGCCDIALGAARILGYDLIENFRAPFEATTFSDFWGRWHISMTGWFRDYVYFPLGGSRCSVPRHLFNLMVVFLVSGLWHGADWRYILWGFSCGAVSVLAQLTKKPRAVLARHNPLYREPFFRRWIQRGIVFSLFCLTLVFFASALYDADPYTVYGGLLRGWQGLPACWAEVTALLAGTGIDGRMPVILTVGVVLVFAAESQGRNLARWIRGQSFVLRWTLYYALGAAILFFAAFGQSSFIYQQY